jgi:hypothetical protein
MKAYKFRPSSQFDYALDIILNHRLYCSDWSKLNDPMEGAFGLSFGNNTNIKTKELFEKIGKEKDLLRVCSLSETYDSHLLWAHYASGFSGLAIEIDFPESHSSIHRISYGGVFAFMEARNISDPKIAAKKILSSKYREWEYEKEIRIINDCEWFELPNPVKRVIAGHRMNDSLFHALSIICKEKKIELRKVGIGDEGIDLDSVIYI